MEHSGFGTFMTLTQSGDVYVVATPGHTSGHQSVVIDLGDRRITLAGDSAFDDQQVRLGTIPGIVEDRNATLGTYAVLQRAAAERPTLPLFTHDPANRQKLEAFVSAPRL